MSTNAPRQIETIRFARPTNGSEKPKTNTVVQAEPTILRDQLRRTGKGPWAPSFSVAFRLLWIIRVAAAVDSNILDSDEVYNFWEPLHYLDQGYALQPWETSPVYGVRSWPYILLHLLPAKLPVLLNLEKRQIFFFIRMLLATACALCEAKLYRAVAEKVNKRVGRYMLVFLAFSAGMWSASPAFIPSSFVMMTSSLAFSYAFDLPSRLDDRRTLISVLLFAVGAIVAWPFALALAIPYVLEELFSYGMDKIKPEAWGSWFISRWTRLFTDGLLGLTVLIPVVAIDSLAYGKLTFSAWNLVRYNLFSGGPLLYGTEPWTFYFQNLTINFNIVALLAFISLPALAVTRFVDYHRLGPRPGPEEASPYSSLIFRLAPVYVWLGALTLQPHKEERFMFPIYPLLCFNAAVTLYLIRGWLERAYIKVTASPYQASRSSLFSLCTFSAMVIATLISVGRILALWHYYHAPLDVTFDFQNVELPRVLNATGLLQPQVVPNDGNSKYYSSSKYDSEAPIKLDNLPLLGGISLCIGKEWYRYPGHYLIPTGVNVHFIKSEVSHLLPGPFPPSVGAAPLWPWDGTRVIPDTGLNDKNEEVMSRYVEVSQCDYLFDSDFPLRPVPKHEPRYAIESEIWDRVSCHQFLDTANSGKLSRLLWYPSPIREEIAKVDGGNNFGEFCILRNKARAAERESKKYPAP